MTKPSPDDEYLNGLLRCLATLQLAALQSRVVPLSQALSAVSTNVLELEVATVAKNPSDLEWPTGRDRLP